MTTRPFITCLSLFLPALTLGAEPHPEVQWALDWELEANQCEQPELTGAERDIVDPGQDGAKFRYNVDSNQLARFERQQKRWQRCVERYKRNLLEDFGRMRDSAQYGLTRQQAEQILSNMALIQSVIQSPTGTVDEQEE